MLYTPLSEDLLQHTSYCIWSRYLSTESLQHSRLSFEFLDDLALASVRGRADPHSYLKSQRVGRIGPLLELISLHRAETLPFDALPTCKIGNVLSAALNIDSPAYGSHIKDTDNCVGFVATNRDPHASDQVQWAAFCQKAQQAAEMSLPKSVSQALIGAMREIEDNVHIHSESSYNGIVGYRGTLEEFEFAVIDSGIGVLESLRRSPDYQHLKDSGTALKVALQNGQSRLRYQDDGRGYGFHDLFVSLANLNGELRFRSGDHSLTIDGTAPKIVLAQLSQKVQIPGFLVNIVCRVEHKHILH